MEREQNNKMKNEISGSAEMENVMTFPSPRNAMNISTVIWNDRKQTLNSGPLFNFDGIFLFCFVDS